MASKYIKKFRAPKNFENIFNDFAKEVLRNQPKDIIDFGFQYFKSLEEGKTFDYPDKGENRPEKFKRPENSKPNIISVPNNLEMSKEDMNRLQRSMEREEITIEETEKMQKLRDEIEPRIDEEFRETLERIRNPLMNFLQYLMRAEREIEAAKINLARKGDFNPEDAFRIFMLNENSDKITPRDLKDGLRVLGYHVTDYDIKLLMKKYDLYNNGYISFYDFFDMIVPFEKQYRDMIEKRRPKSCCPCRSDEAFRGETIGAMRDVIDVMIQQERIVNRNRHLLPDNILENEVDTFITHMNTHNSIDGLIERLQANHIFTNQKDANLLFIRLDRHRKGKFERYGIEEEIVEVLK